MKTANKLAQIAKANQQKQKEEKCPHEVFQAKVRWGSHQYVRYVIKRCKELASKGYGSVKITIDRTTDMFEVDEGRNSCYSAGFVAQLFVQNGFDYDTFDDHYDAVTFILYWDKSLSQAPDSEKIGMRWK